jgi:hypothetical protein
LVWLVAIGVIGASACVTRPVISTVPRLSSGPPVPVATTPASVSPSATGSASAADPGSGWTLAAIGGEAANPQVSSVASIPAGFVAVGSAGRAGELPVALSSRDGRTWTPENIGGRGTAPELALAWGERVLAVGGGQTSRCAHPGSEIDTWVRAADGSWAEAPFVPPLCSGGETMVPVILGDHPWLAGDGTADQPFLLESRDGLAWIDHRGRLPDDVFIEEGAVDESGLWLVGRAAADGTAVVLTSRDGTRFIPARIGDPNRSGLGVIATATIDGRLVVVASRDDAIGRLTPDGAGGWTEEPVTGFPTHDVAGDLTGIGATGGPLVAFSGHEAGLPGIWASADGTAWHQVPIPTEMTVGAWLSDVAVGHGIAVLAGHLESADGNGLVGAIWWARASILGG